MTFGAALAVVGSVGHIITGGDPETVAAEGIAHADTAATGVEQLLADKKVPETLAEEGRTLLSRMPRLEAQRKLRKDYQDDDDPENLDFLALHHAFLFVSYNMEAFKKYVEEARKKSAPS